MPVVAGVDGCKRGWLCIRLNVDTGSIDAGCFNTGVELIHQDPPPAIIAIDIPIGLPSCGKRVCDQRARQVLGPRQRSVFPAPIRPAIDANTREEASQITHERDGRKVGAHGWGIYRKVREIDQILVGDPRLQARVREVHPEVSFWAWNGMMPMHCGKKTREGYTERRALVDRCFGPAAFEEVRDQFRVKDVAGDDILDAFAALWTARRILHGEATTLPDDPSRDAVGLRMEIVY
jgi:predicted RNase H-like nuclease